MSRQISLAGGPGHGMVARGDHEVVHVPVMRQSDDRMGMVEADKVLYRQRVLIVDGKEHTVFVQEGANEMEAAYHVGRLVGAREQSLQGGE